MHLKIIKISKRVFDTLVHLLLYNKRKKLRTTTMCITFLNYELRIINYELKPFLLSFVILNFSFVITGLA